MQLNWLIWCACSRELKKHRIILGLGSLLEEPETKQASASDILQFCRSSFMWYAPNSMRWPPSSNPLSKIRSAWAQDTWWPTSTSLEIHDIDVKKRTLQALADQFLAEAGALCYEADGKNNSWSFAPKLMGEEAKPPYKYKKAINSGKSKKTSKRSSVVQNMPHYT